uniref:Uncharacterized protein n=1 Tax=Anguilla anguilla TaxID=7936 RepID=A0A0E9SAP6_ANGAN
MSIIKQQAETTTPPLTLENK